MTEPSAVDLAADLRAGKVTALEVTEACLARVALDEPRLHAFAHLAPDHARAHVELAQAYRDAAFGHAKLPRDVEATVADAARAHLAEAYVLCPVLANSELLTGHQEDVAHTWTHVARTAPTDATQWYLLGWASFLRDEDARAQAAWRRSLELSERHSASILRHMPK